jgi:hypothetical protein
MQQRARTELEAKTNGEVADWGYERYSNPAAQIAVQSEFLRRQTSAQQEAAAAAVRTAEYSRQSVRYTQLSVIVLVLSALAATLISLLK